MLLAGEVKGELARIQPARACDRRAELVGLLYGSRSGVLRTLDHAIARTAVHLASRLGIPVEPPRPAAPNRDRSRGRRHLVVELDRETLGRWSWDDAPACDRRAFLRGVLLGSGSISFTASGPHVEIVLADSGAAVELQRALGSLEVRALRVEPAEAAKRMRAMRRHLFRNDLDHWATSFIDALRSGAHGGGADRQADRDAARSARRGQPGAQG